MIWKLTPQRKAFHAVISGHSHKPVFAIRGGIIFINPGKRRPTPF